MNPAQVAFSPVPSITPAELAGIVDALVTGRRFDEAARLLDRLSPAEAELQRARIAFFRQDVKAIDTHATEATRLARMSGQRLVEGRALYLRAEGLREAGKINFAGEYYAPAVEILRATENGIYRACAENAYGAYSIACGDEAAAGALFESAIATARALGEEARLATFKQSLLFWLYGRQDYEAAYVGVTTLLESSRDHWPRLFGLRLRTLCLFGLGERWQTLAAAIAYQEHASGEGWDGIASRLLVARARAVNGHAQDLATIGAQAIADAAEQSTSYANTARLWLWAALYAWDPVEACRRRGELLDAAENDPDPFVRFEVRAVARAEELATPDTNIDRVWAAAEARAYLLAYRRTKGNASQMEGQLGKTKRHVANRLGEMGLQKLGRGRIAKKSD